MEPQGDVGVASLIASDSGVSAWVLKVTEVQEARTESHSQVQSQKLIDEVQT